LFIYHDAREQEEPIPVKQDEPRNFHVWNASYGQPVGELGDPQTINLDAENAIKLARTAFETRTLSTKARGR